MCYKHVCTVRCYTKNWNAKLKTTKHIQYSIKYYKCRCWVTDAKLFACIADQWVRAPDWLLRHLNVNLKPFIFLMLFDMFVLIANGFWENVGIKIEWRVFVFIWALIILLCLIVLASLCIVSCYWSSHRSFA